MSIIEKDNKVQAKWMAFKALEDKIEGTLVSKRTVLNQLSGKDQIIYELKVPKDTEVIKDGEKETSTFEEYWNIGGKFGIDRQMQHVRLGQIVGFVFESEKENSNPALNATKIIQVYADPKIVDEEWIQAQDEVDEGGKDDLTKAEEAHEELEKEKEKPPFPTLEKPTKKEDDNVLMEINKLAMEKLGAKNAEEVKQKSMEATDLAFIESNLPKILEALKALPKK